VQSLDPQHKAILFALAQWGLSVPHYLVMIIVLNFYLLDLPVRRAQGPQHPVLEVATGLRWRHRRLQALRGPHRPFRRAHSRSPWSRNLLFTAIWNLRAVFGHSPDLVSLGPSGLLKVETLMLLGLIVSILWYSRRWSPPCCWRPPGRGVTYCCG